MPGRFPLTPVPLFNDPFCEDGFCFDPFCDIGESQDGLGFCLPAGNPVYDYSAFGNIPVRVFWTSDLYEVRTFNGAVIQDFTSSTSGTFDVTTGTVWLATQDLNYPAPVPNSQPFPPVGYFSPRLYWDVPTGMPNAYLLSRNGAIIFKNASTNITGASGLYGSNPYITADSSWSVGQTLAITKIELRGNVAGLGVIGDDITAQGLVFVTPSSGGLPFQQIFFGPANATP